MRSIQVEQWASMQAPGKQLCNRCLAQGYHHILAWMGIELATFWSQVGCPATAKQSPPVTTLERHQLPYDPEKKRMLKKIYDSTGNMCTMLVNPFLKTACIIKNKFCEEKICEKTS